MDKKTLIGIYETEISNLEWTLKENNDRYTDQEKHTIHVRIADRKQFLYYINKLP